MYVIDTHIDGQDKLKAIVKYNFSTPPFNDFGDPKEYQLDAIEEVFSILKEYSEFIHERCGYEIFLIPLIAFVRKNVCNCSYGLLKERTKKQLLELINSIEDNYESPFKYDLDFWTELAKGYAYLVNGQDSVAYGHLNNACSLDHLCDFAFSLRAQIDPEINPNYLVDARMAISLKPNARNYFVLGMLTLDSEQVNSVSSAIRFFDNAASFASHFVCQHRYTKLYNYPYDRGMGGVNSFCGCICLWSNDAQIESLWLTLLRANRKWEALSIAWESMSVRAGRIKYLVMLSSTQAELSILEASLENSESFLIQKESSGVRIENSNWLVELALKTYIDRVIGIGSKGGYSRALKLFNDFLSNDVIQTYLKSSTKKYWNLSTGLSYGSAHEYLSALLYVNDANVQLSREHNYYKKLEKLRTSFIDKKRAHGDLDEEEKDLTKLMVYRSNHRLGFGTFKGQRLGEAIEENPDYVCWCVIHLIHFAIDKNLLILPRVREASNFYKSSEINQIKHIYLADRDLREMRYRGQKIDKKMSEELEIEFEFDQEEYYDSYSSFHEELDDYYDIDRDAFDGDPDAYWNID